jgi:acetolactate synthase regulatory subunit
MTAREAPIPQRITVTVGDVAGVARVISLIRGRQYDAVALDAVSHATGCWMVAVTVNCDEASARLLCYRLDRLVDVSSLRHVC